MGKYDMDSVINKIENELITKEKALWVICNVLEKFKTNPNDEFVRNLVNRIIEVRPSLTKDASSE